ncbi:AraC family transcriptional regulator [Virgibacillus phasianinus]|uniref:AraC family transcriptional regulator n=2 Tax=Virgibacillus phasianinus TaxID=2017483 RepID=A0A220U8S6_9BACI|nr:bifunctional transcriptional activator/DNA repair enzyme AdaA [Virgibacillus phasianinus]ASK64251.1 AraC family transcriptional regulator [Virgibacillus phasianinus]
MQRESQISNEYWQAIVENDSSYDDSFFYGVKTTGIFCRPSCKSKVPNRENVRVFKNARLALSANFRPCKRCKPDGLHLPDEDWVQQITEWIEQNYQKRINLDILADNAHGSPYHLQRLFKRVQGISPLEYIQKVRMKQASRLLVTTKKTVAEVGLAVGMPNAAYFVTLFKEKMNFTPTEYRKRFQKGEGVNE